MLTMRIMVAAAVAALLPTLAAAQNDPRAALRQAIGAAVTPLLGTDSSAQMVEKLMTIKAVPGDQISSKWDLARVRTAAFGRLASVDAPDCRATSTLSGEPDMALCVIEAGDRKSDGAEYRLLAFSKNIGVGDIHYARRAIKLPEPVTLSDAASYDGSVKFLVDTLGVPRSEMAAPPPGVKNPLPVRTMVAGAADERGGNRTSMALQKVVSISRSFFVPNGLWTDPVTRQTLYHVLAPGGATVAFDSSSSSLPVFVHVAGWSDAQLDFRGKPRATAELVNAITDDLWGEGVRKTGTLSILIALRKAYPNPDDPNPPKCPVCGVLRPALRVIVSQAGAGPVDSSEKAWVAPGIVREYDLLDTQFQEDRFAPR